MKNLKTFFNIYIFILGFNIITGTDYCEESLCENSGPFGYKKHIGCENNELISFNCETSAEVIDLEDFIDYLVHRHNYYRNMIAGGEYPGFDSAFRMATMTWDEDLAYLAMLNVQQCSMKGDDCHNTEEYENSGQNRFYLEVESEYNIKDVIYKGLTEWFNENKNCGFRQIDSYYETFKPTEHFTLMVREPNNRVGCAILKQTNLQSYKYYMTCNYATNNIWFEPVYRKGTATEGCTTDATDDKYPALCSVSEEF